MNNCFTIDETLEFIFHTYDTEKKGKLSKAESIRFFKELFMYFKKNPDQTTLEELFKSLDSDNDEFMSKAELKRAIDMRQYFQ